MPLSPYDAKRQKNLVKIRRMRGYRYMQAAYGKTLKKGQKNDKNRALKNKAR